MELVVAGRIRVDEHTVVEGALEPVECFRSADMFIERRHLHNASRPPKRQRRRIGTKRPVTSAGCHASVMATLGVTDERGDVGRDGLAAFVGVVHPAGECFWPPDGLFDEARDRYRLI